MDQRAMTDGPKARRRLFNFRASEEEVDRLRVLAKHYGLNVSQVVRMLAKREADRLWGEPGASGGAG